MTRRKFIHKLVSAGLAAAAGIGWLVKKVPTPKFVWAGKLNKFPGSLTSLKNIDKQSKWSG